MHIFARKYIWKDQKRKNKSVLYKLYNDNSGYQKDNIHLRFYSVKTKSFPFPYFLLVLSYKKAKFYKVIITNDKTFLRILHQKQGKTKGYRSTDA